MDYRIKDYKAEFLRIYKENITREGSKELLNYIESSDFFTAPASTRFHSAFEGGLCEHSVKAYYRFMQLLENEYEGDFEEKLNISYESVAIIALLHDICKVGFYKMEFRNVKNEYGEWDKKPYYTIDDSLPYGHGEKSVYMISGFMRLKREEAMAINWHMGGFDTRVLGGSYGLSDAFYKYPVALLFHIADVQATYLDETISR
ncbi:MAG: hydrolase [Clostridiales bacterium]|nr:hydrolase [Clostridiales bacterium]